MHHWAYLQGTAGAAFGLDGATWGGDETVNGR